MFHWAEETYKTEGLGLQSIGEDGIMKRKYIIVSHETGHRTIFRAQTGLQDSWVPLSFQKRDFVNIWPFSRGMHITS